MAEQKTFGWFRSGFMLMAVLALQGCGTTRMITIESSPPGADIIADGKRIGTTPMEIDTEEVFPPRWIGGTFIVKGKLELEKQGCEAFKMDVDDFILMKDISQPLECQPGSETKGAIGPMGVENTDAVQGENNIEQRLHTLKEIFEKGLITKQEYEQQRQRILNDL